MLIAKRELNVASRGPFLSRYISFSTVISLSHTHSHTHTHKHPHTVRKILCYLSTQFSPLSLSLPYSLRFKTVSVGLEPLEDRPRRLRGLVLPHSLSPCHAFSQRDLSFFFFLSVAQQRPRKGPHFSSEGVSPRGNCAIATSAPVKPFFVTHPGTFAFASSLSLAIFPRISLRSSIPDSRGYQSKGNQFEKPRVIFSFSLERFPV